MKSSAEIIADVVNVVDEQLLTSENISLVLKSIAESCANKLEVEIVEDILDVLPETATAGKKYIINADRKVYTFLTADTTDGGVSYPAAKSFKVKEKNYAEYMHGSTCWYDVAGRKIVSFSLVNGDNNVIHNLGALFGIDSVKVKSNVGVWLTPTAIEETDDNTLKITMTLGEETASKVIIGYYEIGTR